MSNNKPFSINNAQLFALCPNLSVVRAISLADIITKCFNKYGLNTVNKAEELLANLIEETGEFRRYSENFNYTPAQLLKQWPTHFSTATANAFGRTPGHPANAKLIAELAYGGRMGNGPAGSMDGWRFSGKGAIQLTGRTLYTLYGKYIRKTPEQVVELLTQDQYAIDSACWYFVVQAGLTDESEKDMWLNIVRTINGGLINLATRDKYLAKVKAILI